MNGINEKGRLIEKYLPVDYQDVFLVRTNVNGLPRRRLLPKYSRIALLGSGDYTNFGHTL